MDYISIILIALGLSMDSLAVSIASGITIKRFKLRHVLRISIFLAFFQGMMPVIGWFTGIGFKQYIVEYDHWIAFGLLLFLGSKMIWDGITKTDDDEKGFDPLKFSILIGLSIATSIDALVVGVSFAFLDIDIMLPVLIIGLVTLIVSFIGLIFGIKFGTKYDFKIEIIGGLILVGIGTKILLEHTLLA